MTENDYLRSKIRVMEEIALVQSQMDPASHDFEVWERICLRLTLEKSRLENQAMEGGETK